MPPLTPQEVFNDTSTSRPDLHNVKWIKLRASLKFQRLKEKAIGLLTPSGSIRRRQARFSSEKRKRSTTSTSSEPFSPEPADSWSIFSKIWRMGEDSECDTLSVSPTGSPTSSRGRPVHYRSKLSNFRSTRRKSIVGLSPKTPCLDLSKPENSTPNYSRPLTRYSAIYSTGTGFKGTTDAIARVPSTGKQQPSDYHQKHYEDNYLQISDHKFGPPSVPCCRLHANIATHDRNSGSQLGLSTSNSSNLSVLGFELQEPSRRSSTTLPTMLMANLLRDYPHSAAEEHREESDTVTLVERNLTPPHPSRGNMSLASQMGIQNPYTFGCVSLPSQALTTPPAENLPDRRPIFPRSSTEQASTTFKKRDINIHTICDEIIPRAITFFIACLSWMPPMFPC
ncbi:hypothetical protein L211DRAFT_590417 [Terfezia boudieri ATCC MYA-4762]|uniref:Uncharacterized protein n=1 Tax=Terfezia boudieri ATCC MYA-4762 TaxID=1051890 RepID=A0A3N4LEB1_9PEZI|nr:hypothetical protein L211DRAFT_590417 [Terfezia boudieri ATCC MYA-4762]